MFKLYFNDEWNLTCTIIYSICKRIKRYNFGFNLTAWKYFTCSCKPKAGQFQDDYGAGTSSLLGFVFIIIGTLPFVFLNLNSNLVLITIVYCFRMIGLSFLITPLQAYGVDPFPRSDYSHGTAILNSLRQITGALGTNILVAIVTFFSLNGNVDCYGINISFLIQVILMLFALVIILKYIQKSSII